MLGITTTHDPGTSGIKDIAEALGGGLKEGSFVVIEGEPKTGKSVLCQHIVYGILNTQRTSVAYYSSEYNTDGLTVQMDSLSLDTADERAEDRLRVFKIYSKTVVREPEKSLKLILTHVQGLPPHFRLIVIDSPSVYLTRVNPVVKVDFLQSCKEMCDKNRTIVMALDTSAFDNKSLHRAFTMSDYYIRLKNQDSMIETGKIDVRNIKMMEVKRLAGAERWGQPGMKFEIKPRVGIQLLPFMSVKI
jgi:archaellum biogenesis ATPase FlaH